MKRLLLTFDEHEEKAIDKISAEKLSEFQKLSCLSDTGEEQKHMTKKIRLTQIEEEIEELLSKVSWASGVRYMMNSPRE